MERFFSRWSKWGAWIEAQARNEAGNWQQKSPANPPLPRPSKILETLALPVTITYYPSQLWACKTLCPHNGSCQATEHQRCGQYTYLSRIRPCQAFERYFQIRHGFQKTLTSTSTGVYYAMKGFSLTKSALFATSIARARDWVSTARACLSPWCNIKLIKLESTIMAVHLYLLRQRKDLLPKTDVVSS